MDKQRGIIERFLYAKCAFSYSLIFLPFISSAFVPTNTIPQVVQAFAKSTDDLDDWSHPLTAVR